MPKFITVGTKIINLDEIRYVNTESKAINWDSPSRGPSNQHVPEKSTYIVFASTDSESNLSLTLFGEERQAFNQYMKNPIHSIPVPMPETIK